MSAIFKSSDFVFPIRTEDKAKFILTYLENTGFISAFEKVVLKMFAMDPDLPTDPIKYIKENIGYTMKEGREVARQLDIVLQTCAAVEKENELLTKYLDKMDKSEQSMDWDYDSDVEEDVPEQKK